MRIRDMAEMYPFPLLPYSAPVHGPEHSHIRRLSGMRIVPRLRNPCATLPRLARGGSSRDRRVGSGHLLSTGNRPLEYRLPTMDKRYSAHATSSERRYRLCWSIVAKEV